MSVLMRAWGENTSLDSDAVEGDKLEGRPASRGRRTT